MHSRFSYIAAIAIAGSLLISACSEPTASDEEIDLSQNIDVGGYFTFSLPSDATGSCGWGVDTFIGQYQSPTMSCGFDFGPWSARPWTESTGRILTTEETINGYRAILQFGYFPGRDSTMPYWAYAYFPDGSNPAYSKLGFSVHGTDQFVWKLAHAIFRSIRFLV
jgi:hypothetical protein